jgi:serine/threonine protein kinase/WD40 repeat protein
MPEDSVLLGELAEEFSARVRRGDMPEVEEYAGRHPALAERIRALFPTLMLLEGMAAGGAKSAAAAHGADLAPGSLFGAYRIEREVGLGGMGVVYEAVHLTLQRRVALKVLPVSGPRAAAQLERFLREARTAAGLHHTNIVPVFDVGQVGGTPYYAMQFIEGKSLDHAAKPIAPPTAELDPARTQAEPSAPSGPPPASTEAAAAPAAPPRGHYGWVAEVGVQAAEALAYAHARGVIHRDIKPSNLLLDGQGVVWVTDFGLARRLDDAALTHSGQLLGTPRYMSPEQAQAAKSPVDHRTDIYSLGATLYELLARRPPFDGPTPLDVVLQILERAPVPPRRLDPKVPRDLETVILKAMAKRPADRYQSARELADDLRRFLKAEPIKARRISVFGRAARWARRNPAVAALLATVALALLAGTAVSTFFAVEATEQAREADAARVRAGRDAERNLRLLYVATINLAQAAFHDHRFDRTLELLKEARPEQGKEDLRGWEWHYLWNTLNRQARRLPLGHALLLGRDGKHFITADKNALLVRELPDGGVRLRLPRKGGPPRDVALSPDGRLFGRLDTDSWAVWELNSTRQYGPFRAEGRAWTLALAGDRAALGILRSPAKGAVGKGPAPFATAFEIRERSTGCLLRTLEIGPDSYINHTAAFSADGALLVTIAGEEVAVWEADTGKKRFHVQRRSPRGRSPLSAFHTEAALDPAGRYLALVEGQGKSVGLHALKDGKTTRTLPPFPTPVTALAFSPDGTRLVAAEESGSVTVLDLRGRAAPQTFYHIYGPATQLAFRPGGRTLLGQGAGGLQEWDLSHPDRLLVPGLRTESPDLFEPALGPQGRRLAAVVEADEEGDSSPAVLKVWDVRTGQVVFRRGLSRRAETGGGLVWGPDGRRLALWHSPWAGLSHLRLPAPGEGLGGLLTAVAFAWEHVHRLRVWDVEAGREEAVPQPPYGWERRALFTPDGRLLLSDHRTGWVLRDAAWVLRDAATGRQLLSVPGGQLEEPGVAFSADGRLLAAITSRPEAGAARDEPPPHEFSVWEMDSGRLLARRSIPVSVGIIHALRFRPDGQAVAALIEPHAAKDTTWTLAVHLWEAADGWQGRKAWQQSGEGLQVSRGTLTFSPDGRRFAVGLGRLVWVCAAATGEALHTLAGHNEDVRALTFSADGKRLFACSDALRRQEVKVWDVGTGRELLTLPLPRGISYLSHRALHFSGQRLLVPGWNGEGVAEVRVLDGTPAEARDPGR